MANQEHLERLLRGAREWNRWREKHPGIQPDISKSVLSKKDLSGADLSGADLSGTYFDAANLSNANLVMTNLRKSNLSEANLSGADLSVSILDRAILDRAILDRANFTAANLRGVNLSEVYLGEAILHSTDLSEAKLNGAYLSEDDLREADLSKADLSRADLSEADLSGADLSGAILNGSNFRGANIGRTIFGYVDLSTVKGLDTLFHLGPSTIGIDTIYRSRGLIPKVFLQGSGIPERFIHYMHLLIDESITFCSCFISYSSRDETFVKRLHADLQSKGVRCWFAPEDLEIGAKIRPSIDESIGLYDKLLLVLSEYSVTSQWVEQEVETALEKERKENRIVLFPIRLDNTVMGVEEGWPLLVRNTRHIGDFTCWKDQDSYQKVFERLLRNLKAEATKG